tara:strand:- start:1189 stop:1824 length:636 start_codon:yes stop_codon:yes gene_type:complete
MINLDFLNDQKEVTYNIENFKGWHKKKNFTGDIWDTRTRKSKYEWKIECFKAIIQQLQPRVIFETGFNVGRSSATMLNYCDSDCRVYSMDKNKKCRPFGDALSEIFPNFELIIGNTDKKLAPILKEKQLKIDLAFIDGSHDPAVAKRDIICVQQHMNDNGCILIDDRRIKKVRRAVARCNWDAYENIEVPKYEGGAYLYQKCQETKFKEIK